MAKKREPKSKGLNFSPEDVAKTTKEQGGITINPRTGRPATSGTLVSIPGHEERVPVSRLTGESIQRYAHTPEHIEALIKKQSRHLGTWVDADEAGTPTAFLDVSERYPSTPRGNRMARQAMVTGEQFAGFNIDKGTPEFNPTHPSILQRVAGAPVLQPGEAERWRKSEAPIGEEVVFGETTVPQTISRGRGRKRQNIGAGQGVIIFTGPGGQLGS